MINVRNVSKIYKLYDKPIDRLKEAFNPFAKKYHRDFYALKDVSFSLNKGECLGILGKNGAGKSTLLQILTGVVTPTTGLIDIRGKVSALLELGAGFNPELSGIENVYFKCSLQGLSKEQTSEKLDEILSFADIGDFINQPVKTYSSGMFVRLAFAVAINVDPDILIIDEALSVGDFRFQQKCFRKLNEFRENNKTIIFVSHSQQSIIQFCTKALWIYDGIVKVIGSPKEICKDYISYMSFGEISNSVKKSDGTVNPLDGKTSSVEDIFRWTPVETCKSYGDLKAEILGTSLTACSDQSDIRIFDGGVRVTFAIQIKINNEIENPIVGFQFSDNKGIYLFGMNSISLACKLDNLNKGDIKIVTFEFDFPLLRIGKYSFCPAIASGSFENHTQHHWVHDAYVIEIGNKDMIAQMGCYLIMKDNVKFSIL